MLFSVFLFRKQNAQHRGPDLKFRLTKGRSLVVTSVSLLRLDLKHCTSSSSAATGDKHEQEAVSMSTRQVQRSASSCATSRGPCFALSRVHYRSFIRFALSNAATVGNMLLYMMTSLNTLLVLAALKLSGVCADYDGQPQVQLKEREQDW